MNLIDKIRADQLQARKERNTPAIMLLTTLIGEAMIIGKNDGGRETNDTEVISVIKKFLKGVNETIPLVTSEAKLSLLNIEKTLLEGYLPQQYGVGEIKTIIMNAEIAPFNKGNVMKFMKTYHAGMYDGSVLSKVFDEMQA